MRTRLPSWPDLISVFAVVATFAYGWTLVMLFYKIPSYLLIITPGEIFAVASYVVLAALIETVLVTTLIVLLGFLLPRKMLLGEFVVRGTWAVIMLYAGMIIFFLIRADWGSLFLSWIYAWTAVMLSLCVLAVWYAPRVKLMRAVATWAADRFQVFGVIFIPLNIVCLINILIRNIL